jgi:carboxyl-terminal processing protease
METGRTSSRLVRRSALIVAGLAMLAVATAYLASAAKAPGSDAFDGIWQSRGYGWLWQVKGGKVARFDIGKGFCIPSSYAGTDRIGSANHAQLSDNRQTLRLLQEDPDYFYSFERLPDLPAQCGRRADSSALAVFDALAENFETHYAFFNQRGIDWSRLVHEARGKISADMDEADLFDVFGELLTPFGDTHVGLAAEIDGEEESISATDEQPRTEPHVAVIPGTWSPSAAGELLGRSARQEGDELLLYGRLNKDVGYLEIRAMEGMTATELESALDRAIKTFADAEAVVVDVSRNDGGLDSFARRIARRFAVEPTIAYSKYAGDYDGDRPQEIVLRPSERPRYLGPVYLITSHDTVSAAEIFAMAMRALPNVVHLGETTDGSLSDELWKTLPNGWILSLSNEVYLDSDGKLWEGRGVPPEFRLAISDEDEVTEEDEQTVRDVLAFIGKQLD